MFKFNFIANDDESKLAKSAMSDSDLQPDDDNSKTPICEEHLITNADQTGVRFESLNVKSSTFENETILLVNQLDVPKTLSSQGNKENDDIAFLVESKTDLVTGVYEGGFKVWECSYDLLSYLSQAELESLKSINVLDLGCGSGLLGIYCAMHGAKQVTFQDYNAEVVRSLTIPNYVANILNKSDKDCFPSFYSGSWNSFKNASSKHKRQYDLIITSETIYNTEHYSTLLEVFDAYLSPEGKVLVAAKVNYFGVGGGLRQFEQALSGNESNNSKWTHCTIKVFDDNVKREIVEIKRKS